MKQYNVTGMTCAACSARVEKAVGKVSGVKSCAVSLLTNSMSVEGGDTADIIKAVEDAGYGASPKDGSSSKKEQEDDALRDKVTPKLKKRLLYSCGFLIILMYVSMGHTMWGWPLPPFFDNNPLAVGLVQLLLTVVIMVINGEFFVSGYKSLLRRAPNMDTLVALGSSAAFGYSLYALFAMTVAYSEGSLSHAEQYLHELYFESAAMILTLITVGKTLEAYSKGRTTDALKSLISLAPKTASVVRDGTETEIPASEVKKGDIFVVRPGDGIPADGIVIEGHSAVNESALTGESIPIEKSSGSTVSAATVNTSGFLKCEAVRVGEDTALSGIIRMVSDAAATKAPIAKIADKVSGVFVPAVMIIAAVTVIVWMLCGQTFGFALARGISVLVISCPCALGLATPVAIMVGSGVGAKNGILFKTASALEEAGRINTVVLDKTGTVTTGKPVVTGIYPADGISEEVLLKLASSLEAKSEHPLARAVIAEAEKRNVSANEVTDFAALPGNGLTTVLNGSELAGGNLKFIESKAKVPDSVRQLTEELAEQGQTPLFFLKDDIFLGVIMVADAIKEDSPRAVGELRRMGLRVVMLTGDNENTARAVGAAAGIDAVFAGVLPDGKEAVIRELQASGKVAMVGDGINDAPALTRADSGIAIGAGTDAAIDAADVVLMKSNLSDVPAAIRLGRATLRNIRQNLFWAFIYNCIGIPLAAGVFISLLGWELNPMFGAAAMSLSSFCVVTNALRLNFADIHSSKRDRKLKSKSRREKAKMEKTLKIEGMMCAHCEAHVKKALEALEGVTAAEVSHKKGTAVVTCSSEVSEESLKTAVEAEGYKVL